jgi:hypothetical protein
MIKPMTKGERDDLLRLVRQRERVLKSAAEQRGNELMVEFERNVTAIHSYDKDEVWNAAMEAAKAAVEEAKRLVAERCEALGIPEEFAPEMHLGWYGRGSGAVRDRQNELRRLAKAEVVAITQRARVEIERMSVSAQTEIIANGLQSEVAQAFLANLPTVEKLMPMIDMASVEKKMLERRRPSYDA